MKYKKNSIILFCIGVVLIAIGLFINFNSSEQPEIDNKTNHRDEFEIVNSNYLERYYKRYKAFKEKYSDYDDDTIITYVNIGLDKKDYVDPVDTNVNDGILMIVNKHNIIKDDYKPNTSVIGDSEIEVANELLNDYNAMVEEAKNYKINLSILQGYTTPQDQQLLYDICVSDNGEEGSLNIEAKPGYSDYQTGLALSIKGSSIDFKDTKEYSWLETHAHEYGFILRYPKGKEKITGFDYAPWHWRYVGKDVAKIIHEKDITFEEYYATYVLK